MKQTTLSAILINQAEHLNDLSGKRCSLLYDEITNFLKDYKGLNIVDEIKNPTSIKRSDNFQYLFEGENVTIINKYF